MLSVAATPGIGWRARTGKTAIDFERLVEATQPGSSMPPVPDQGDHAAAVVRKALSQTEKSGGQQRNSARSEYLVSIVWSPAMSSVQVTVLAWYRFVRSPSGGA